MGVYYPVAITGMILFYRHRHRPMINKRRVRSTMTVMILCLLSNLDRVLWTVYICDLSNLDIFRTVSILIYPVIIYCTLYALFCRFWIQRFLIQWTRHTMNQKWKSIINAESVDDRNWYIFNKSKWGNEKFFSFTIVAPCCSISIILSIILRLNTYSLPFVASSSIHSDHEDPHPLYDADYIHLWIADALGTLVPYTLIVCLWCSMPLFYDKFWIRQSSRAIFMVLLVLFSTNLTFGIIAIYSDQRHHVLLSLIESHIICASNLSIIVISTFLVFYKNRSSFAPEHNLSAFLSSRGQSARTLTRGPSAGVLTTLSSTPSAIFKRQKSDNSATKPIHSRIVLKSVLRDPMWFDQFMAHLGTEFSSFDVHSIMSSRLCPLHFHSLTNSQPIRFVHGQPICFW